MAVAGGNVQFVDAVILGVNSPNVEQNAVPTLIAKRSTADPVRQNISFAGNIQCVNFIAGMFATFLTATMAVNASYLLLNTGSGNVVLSLDNSGTVGGTATYNLAPGAIIKFFFDGTNLS